MSHIQALHPIPRRVSQLHQEVLFQGDGDGGGDGDGEGVAGAAAERRRKARVSLVALGLWRHYEQWLPSVRHFMQLLKVRLARLEMPPALLYRLTSRHPNPPSTSFRCGWPAWKCVAWV